MLALDFRNRNILFWQDGELLVNRVATRLRASVELDRAQRTLTLHDALLGINGTELDLTGTVRRDTARAGALLLDLRYGLHVPSLETVLHMIPESVLKRGEVAADGEVRISGAVKGPYGRQALPLATLDAEIKDASAHYAGMPYGVDALDARLVGQVDPMRREPSFCNLEIFPLQGCAYRYSGRCRGEEPAGRSARLVPYEVRGGLDGPGADFPVAGRVPFPESWRPSCG